MGGVISRLGIIAGIGVLVIVSATAQAQDFKRVAPQQPPPSPPSQILPPSPAVPGANENRVILKTLKGLRLVGDVGDFKRAGATETGISIVHVPLLESFSLQITAQMQPYLGQPVTFGTLRQIEAAIVDWYREHDQPVMNVVVPEQDVTSGVVQLIVMEFRIGRIDVTGNKWFSADLLRDEFGYAAGDTLDSKIVESRMDWVNQNPFRHSDLVLGRGEQVGTTDLVLRTQDRFPARVYFGYDNTGVPILTRDRWSLGFNYGNLFGLDQQLSYQFTSSDDFWRHREIVNGNDPGANFVAHAVTYVVPLPWRDKLLIFGSIDRETIHHQIFPPGHSGQASIRYIASLPSVGSLTQELAVGYDFKTTDNNLQFNLVNLAAPSVSTEIDQFPITYTATVPDPWGITRVENSLVASPGGMTQQNNTAAFESNTALASPHYVYDQLGIVRETSLPYRLRWIMRLTGQVANRVLLPSEQLGAGGIDSIRGYDERAAEGSIGALVSQQLQSPDFSLYRWLGDQDIGDRAELHVFWDYGSVRDPKTVAGARSSTQLASVGTGMTYAIDRYLNFRLEYGWQLRKVPTVPGHGEFGAVSVTVSY